MMYQKKRVTLFIQCLVDTLYPEVAEAMVSVLEGLGLELDCPTEQTCCGQPAFNSGHHREARSAAVKFIELFEDAEVIVSPSGSCVNMVRHHYPDLFSADPSMLERARAVAAKTFEFTEFLVDILKVENLDARFPAKVTYHDSCHLNRYLGIHHQPRKLLSNIRDLEFIEMKDSDKCCGFGGTFAVKYADISTAILEEKVQNIVDSGATVVTGCDMSCLMNIQGMLSRTKAQIKVMHIAQLLSAK
jgi:L-lactate dehydrogenase complex protein LldE